MLKSMFAVAIFLFISLHLSYSQITQAWESPSSNNVFAIWEIGLTSKFKYYCTYDYSAQTVSFYDATSFSLTYSIPNSDSSGFYYVIPDVNGNGYPDVIAYKSSKNITIRDLHTGSIIYTISPPSGYYFVLYGVGTTANNNVLKLLIGKISSASSTLLVYSLGVNAPSSISTIENEVPATFILEQNYPNPFNPSTIIKYTISSAENVHIIIYNSAGQSLRELTNSVQQAGEHTITWDGKDNSDKLLPSGVYFYQIHAGQNSQARKMILLK